MISRNGKVSFDIVLKYNCERKIYKHNGVEVSTDKGHVDGPARLDLPLLESEHHFTPSSHLFPRCFKTQNNLFARLTMQFTNQLCPWSSPQLKNLIQCTLATGIITSMCSGPEKLCIYRRDAYVQCLGITVPFLIFFMIVSTVSLELLPTGADFGISMWALDMPVGGNIL